MPQRENRMETFYHPLPPKSKYQHQVRIQYTPILDKTECWTVCQEVLYSLDRKLLQQQDRASFVMPLHDSWDTVSSEVWSIQENRDLLVTCFMVLKHPAWNAFIGIDFVTVSPSLWKTLSLLFLSDSQWGALLAQSWVWLPFVLPPDLGNHPQVVTTTITRKWPDNICDNSHLHGTEGRNMLWCVRGVTVVYHPKHKNWHLFTSQRKWYIAEHSGWGTARLVRVALLSILVKPMDRPAQTAGFQQSV